MAEEKNRIRRSQRYAQTPERVSAAAQSNQQGSPFRQEQGAASQDYDQAMYQQEMARQQYEAQQEYARRQYEAQQYAMQQEAARQQYEAQQEYARQQYAAQQEQKRRQTQNEERERVSSQTSRQGAFRGYTGEMPNLGNGNASPSQPPKQKKGKARMKRFGKVDIPSEAFTVMLKRD